MLLWARGSALFSFVVAVVFSVWVLLYVTAAAVDVGRLAVAVL